MDAIKKRSCRRRMGCFFTGLTAALLGLGVLILYLQVVIITRPFRNQAQSLPLDVPYQEVSLTTSDGLTIRGWYVSGRRAEAIVLVHGIHANRSYLAPEASILAEAGYHLLLIDLRGHGQSEGNELTYGYREALDVQAAVDYLAAQPEVEAIGALGHSLGGAAVVHAAASEPRLQAIVVQSSYRSLPLVIEESFEKYSVLPRWPFAPLIIGLAEFRLGMHIDQVDSARDLAEMPPRPVLIIHSADDPLFPPHHARALFAAAAEPKALLTVAGVGHVNPIFGDEATYRARLLDFFERAFE